MNIGSATSVYHHKHCPILALLHPKLESSGEFSTISKYLFQPRAEVENDKQVKIS